MRAVKRFLTIFVCSLVGGVVGVLISGCMAAEEVRPPTEMVYDSAGGVVRISRAACPFSWIPEKENYSLGEALIGGEKYELCWRRLGDYIQLRYDDGDVGFLEAAKFRPAAVL